MKLIRKCVQPNSLLSYDKALNQFLNWIPKGEKLHDGEHLAVMCRAFLHQKWEERETPRQYLTLVTHVKNALLLYFPEHADHFKLVTKDIRGWKNATRFAVEHYKPVPKEVAFAIAHSLMRRNKWTFGIFMLLQYDLYLRAGDLLGLHLEDITIFQRPTADNSHASVNIRLGKNGEINHATNIRWSFLAKLVSKLIDVRRTMGETKLLSTNLEAYRNSIKEVVQDLNLPYEVFPHDVRYGGATADFLQGFTKSAIQSRGRWSDGRMLNRYISKTTYLKRVKMMTERDAQRWKELVANPERWFGVESKAQDKE